MRFFLAIFKVSNIAEAGLISFALVTGIYISYHRLTNNAIGQFVVISILLLGVFSIANCINNISLISVYSKNKWHTNIKSLYFWIISILFALSIFLRCFSTYSVISHVLQLKEFRKLDTQAVTMLWINTVFILNGLFILSSQLVLFLLIKKRQKEIYQQEITKIGQET